MAPFPKLINLLTEPSHPVPSSFHLHPPGSPPSSRSCPGRCAACWRRSRTPPAALSSRAQTRWRPPGAHGRTASPLPAARREARRRGLRVYEASSINALQQRRMEVEKQRSQVPLCAAPYYHRQSSLASLHMPVSHAFSSLLRTSRYSFCYSLSTHFPLPLSLTAPIQVAPKELAADYAARNSALSQDLPLTLSLMAPSWLHRSHSL